MEWMDLSSRQNPAVKRVVSLRDKKARDSAGLFAVEGIRFIGDLSRDGIYPESLFLCESARISPDRAATFAGKNTMLYLVSSGVYEKISLEQAGEGVLAVYDKACLPAPSDAEKRVLALEGVQDPGNVGACIRSAAALGFDEVWLSGCADPLGPKALRASMGAVFRTPVKILSSGEEILSLAREKGLYSVAACLSDDAVPLNAVALKGPVCLLIGNEGHGLSQTVSRGADQRAVIPMAGMESVNAAAAAAIFMWEAVRHEA